MNDDQDITLQYEYIGATVTQVIAQETTAITHFLIGINLIAQGME